MLVQFVWDECPWGFCHDVHAVFQTHECRPPADGDIEEIYFDDELDSNLEHDKYMRLQGNAAAMETPAADSNLNSVLRLRAMYSAPGSATQLMTSPPTTTSGATAAVSDDSTLCGYTPGVLSSGRFKVRLFSMLEA